MNTNTPRYDVAVIGAGINGAGIALDAALRGLRVVILDKNDMCTGCSAISSRLIHGGLRYLEYGEIPLVYESLHERRYLRINAPHLVEPLRICLPIYEGAKRGPLMIRLGMVAYDLLSMGKQVPNHEMLDGEEILAQEPGLKSEGLRAAARYYDAQVAYAERLVLEILLAARAAGAEILTHTEVTAISFADGAVESITCLDRLDESQQEMHIDTVINAAGPWVDRVLETAPVSTFGSRLAIGSVSGGSSGGSPGTRA